MKKAYFIILLVFHTYSHNGFLSQTHFEGNKIITPYYGFPNFGFLTLSNSELNGLNAKYNSIGPIGIRGEFLVSSNVGLGFDLIYNSYKLNFTRETSTYDGNSDKWLTEYTEVQKEMKRLRFQFRYNYHFDSSNPNLDWYSGFGVGSNSRKYKQLENGIATITPPSQTQDSTTNFTSSQNKAFPISLRIFCGVNYYFNSRIASGIELGLGGALFSASISYKLF
jgi:hypothetical protein